MKLLSLAGTLFDKIFTHITYNGIVFQKFLMDDLHMLAVQEIHGAGQPNGLEYMQTKIKAAEMHKTYADWKRKVQCLFKPMVHYNPNSVCRHMHNARSRSLTCCKHCCTINR